MLTAAGGDVNEQEPLIYTLISKQSRWDSQIKAVFIFTSMKHFILLWIPSEMHAVALKNVFDLLINLIQLYILFLYSKKSLARSSTRPERVWKR